VLWSYWRGGPLRVTKPLPTSTKRAIAAWQRLVALACCSRYVYGGCLASRSRRIGTHNLPL
jgi:hypothetical protein